MSDTDRYFHEVWLGMVQPVDGLVVSIPVLVEAQCMERQPPHVQLKLIALCPPTEKGDAGPEGFAIGDLGKLFSDLLGLTPELFDAGDALPEEVSLYVPEGGQTLRPTMALKKQVLVERKTDAADATPAAVAGSRYEMLVWDLPRGLDLDKPETKTGTWDYPPAAKFDRLLRQCRVPIGLLTNRDAVRLIYAPHGESSGAITFRLDDMASVGGRPILDAFVMLLSANRFFGVAEDRSLPRLLSESRKRQANVTNDLADQVFEALQVLLRGFEAAAERDGRELLDDALAREGDHLYKGLLTVLLRLVFLLYAEDRGLLPVEEPLYAEHLSVLGLFEDLQADRGAYPDSMSRRFGAWGRLVTVFRATFLGIEHGALKMPARRGSLFNPHEYPFLEGWGPGGSAPISQPEDRAGVQVPTVDDETVFRVLEKLLVLDGQRLSYRALDVEQIGSVYEALMGYHVTRMPSEAVCLRPHRLWVSAEEVLEVPTARRAKSIKETIGLNAAQAEKLHENLKAGKREAALEALSKYAAGGKKGDPSLSKAKAGQLVLQPGSERRRTSSHYTPRSLSEPIVRRTLEPLLAVMGEAPASDRILSLKVCDPAMGSGAFLVEACRFLADHVVAAWTREKKVEDVAREHGDPLLHARRVVAQRCLYGVDKNDAAVELAKLSLWLVTLSRNLPFTFLDHALRHGDSLVGLDFDQIRSFHWQPGRQVELFSKELSAALDEAIGLRQTISDLAFSDNSVDQKEKERLFWDAQDALERVRLIGDVVVGAFFAHEKDKERERERDRRLDLVTRWLRAGGSPSEELREMQREICAKLPVFHWMTEFPEVFFAERPDPLDQNNVNRAAYMDAFLGNPPFAGKNAIAASNDEGYLAWLQVADPGAHGNADLSAHFLRRAGNLLGRNGTFGLISTKSIAQGDTRATGLQRLVANGFTIYDATPSLPWEGSADIVVSVVHLALGTARKGIGQTRLDGRSVTMIDSRLGAGRERADALQLHTSAELSFQGSTVLGVGFTLSPAERETLIQNDNRNAARIFPYLGGEEVNTHPSQAFSRHVINFGQLTLGEAELWPELLALVRERVKPEREANKREVRRQYWWRFGESAPALYNAIHLLSRCLVTARVTKHVCFSFQPIDRVFNDKLYVFPLEHMTHFAILQSQVHGLWAYLLSGSYGAQDTVLAYRAKEVVGTFPFPQPDPRTIIPALEDIGQLLYDFRAKYMVDENVGLTITYNRLKDPACIEPRILELRKLHEEMDRKVLDAYGWSDVEVPPYCPMNDDDRKKLAAFEDVIIDRLFVLNAKRAEEEKLRGLGAGGGKKKGAAKKTSKREKGSGRGTKSEGQLSLTGDDDEVGGA